jgi:hypothetical protein
MNPWHAGRVRLDKLLATCCSHGAGARAGSLDNAAASSPRPGARRSGSELARLYPSNFDFSVLAMGRSGPEAKKPDKFRISARHAAINGVVMNAFL